MMDDVSNPDEGWWDSFPAKLTAKSGTSPILYTFEEQQFDGSSGTYSTIDPARRATDLREISNRDVDVTGTPLVMVRIKGMVRGKVAYEFQAPGGAAALTVREVDGSPTGSTTTIEFDQATGVGVSSIAAGVARVYLLAASYTQMGAVTTGSQSFAGLKTFRDDIQVGAAGGGAGDAVVYLRDHSGAQADITLSNTSGAPLRIHVRSILDPTEHGYVYLSGEYGGAGTDAPILLLQSRNDAGVYRRARFRVTDELGQVWNGAYGNYSTVVAKGGLVVGGTSVLTSPSETGDSVSKMGMETGAITWAADTLTLYTGQDGIGRAVTAKDVNFWRHTGSTAGTNVWYFAGLASVNTQVSDSVGVILPTGTLVSLPIYLPAGGVIDAVGVKVITAGMAGSKIRMGIYRAASNTDLRPSVLVADAGEISSDSTGLKKLPITVALQPGVLYWLAAMGSGGQIMVFFGGSFWPIFGLAEVSGDWVQQFCIGWKATQSYGAMPSSFPTAGEAVLTSTTSTLFGLGYHLAAVTAEPTRQRLVQTRPQARPPSRGRAILRRAI